MSLVPLLARIVIGVVLIFAAVAKVKSRRWAVLAAEMGTPRFVVTTLPAVESMLGLALVLQVGGGVSGWIAVVLFGAFTIVVVRQYVSGSHLPCNCFGAAGGEEAVGKMTIARNVLLVLTAIVATF